MGQCRACHADIEDYERRCTHCGGFLKKEIPVDNRTTVIITGDVDYTHYVCHTCEKVLYCSKAIPFDPQTDYGWCPHMLEEADAHVWTDPPLNGWYHKCEPASADGYKLYLPYHH